VPDLCCIVSRRLVELVGGVFDPLLSSVMFSYGHASSLIWMQQSLVVTRTCIPDIAFLIYETQSFMGVLQAHRHMCVQVHWRNNKHLTKLHFSFFLHIVLPFLIWQNLQHGSVHVPATWAHRVIIS